MKNGVDKVREYLKKIRNEKGLTQLDIAQKLNISESYYNLIEHGERQNNMSIELACKLSEILEIPIEIILEKEKSA